MSSEKLSPRASGYNPLALWAKHLAGLGSSLGQSVKEFREGVSEDSDAKNEVHERKVVREAACVRGRFS